MARTVCLLGTRSVVTPPGFYHLPFKLELFTYFLSFYSLFQHARLSVGTPLPPPPPPPHIREPDTLRISVKRQRAADPISLFSFLSPPVLASSLSSDYRHYIPVFVSPYNPAFYVYFIFTFFFYTHTTHHTKTLFKTLPHLLQFVWTAFLCHPPPLPQLSLLSQLSSNRHTCLNRLSTVDYNTCVSQSIPS